MSFYEKINILERIKVKKEKKKKQSSEHPSSKRLNNYRNWPFLKIISQVKDPADQWLE